MKKEPLVFQFENWEIPYYPSVVRTLLGPDGWIAQPQDPIFITHLKKYQKTGDSRSLVTALTSLLREACNKANEANALKYWGFQGRIVVSAQCPKGHIYIDEANAQICGNEAEFLLFCRDPDGDQAMVSLVESLKNARVEAILIKHPLTDALGCHYIPINKPLRLLPEEFQDFGKKQAKLILEKNPLPEDDPTIDYPQWLQDRFIRFSATPTNVGGVTTRHGIEELIAGADGTTALERGRFLTNGERVPGETEPWPTARLLEVEAHLTLKPTILAQIKGHTKLLADHSKMTIKAPDNLFTISNNRVGQMGPKVLGTLLNQPLTNVLKKVNKLEIEFRPVAEKDEEVTHGFILPPEVDKGLIGRLQQLGLLHIDVIPSTHEGLRKSNCNPIVIHLRSLSGHPVAFTGIKKPDGELNGLTWACVLYPVFSGVDGMVKSPLQALQEAASRYCDSVLRAPNEAGELVPFKSNPFFPKDGTQFLDERYRTKLHIIQDWLTKHLQDNGSCVPATLVQRNGKLYPQITDIAKEVVANTFAIDYFGFNTPDEKLAIWKDCRHLMRLRKSHGLPIDKEVRIDLNVGTKSKGNVKLYLFSEKGYSYRKGRNRSQLLQAAKKVEFTVAIVKMKTKSQSLITPSGIDKQKVEDLFFPQTFNTEEALQEYITSNRLVIKPEDIKTTVLHTWAEETLKIWMLAPKEPILIGKQIDAQNRTVPREIPQCYTINKEVKHEIDLVMPIIELVSKDMHPHWLKDAKEMTLVLPEEWELPEEKRTVKAMVAKVTMFRSGTASENTKGGWRASHQKGLFKFAILNAFYQAGLLYNALHQEVVSNYPVTEDISYPQELLNITREIVEVHGLQETFTDTNAIE